ncbi:MAG: stage II sporulation protein M [Pseudomonadota bacterium]|nr:stage II sporulation protein M [Pseudomonadota bacterium]
MKQQQFETGRHRMWKEYRALLEQLERSPGRRDRLSPLQRFPRLYRRICGHYALARSRGYSSSLTEDLHDLVRRGYQQLYRSRLDWLRQTLAFLSAGFPRAVRGHAGVFWLAAALFFGPMLIMALGCHQDEELIYSLLDRQDIAQLESMYDPTNRKPGREADRQADTDFAMFGFYVMNNVGIAFRTFASGLLLGLGSLFILIFNGLVIGAAAGHLTRLGYGGTFWPFVSGHSALELTAIAVSGAAGLLLAAALLAPGRRRRLDALQRNAREAVKLVTGALAMLVLAAIIEAFWSSATGIEPAMKYLFGGICWLLMIAYLSLAGRGSAGAA